MPRSPAATILSAFEEVERAFVPGINVFLGANATGKSHAMKGMYAPLEVLERSGTTLPAEDRWREKLANVFKPDEGAMGRLVHRRKGQGQSRISERGRGQGP